jgi:hypothetical protein
VNVSLIDELNQILCDLPFNKHQASRKDIAHFCEHDGICIRYTRARTTWRALTPCAFKPWWLFLEPVIKEPLLETPRQIQQTEHLLQEQNNNTHKIIKKDADLEVTDNA